MSVAIVLDRDHADENYGAPVAFARHCGVDRAIPVTREAANRIDGRIGECWLCGVCICSLDSCERCFEQRIARVATTLAPALRRTLASRRDRQTAMNRGVL